jgi:DNA mismatch repair protein MSH5
VTPAPPYEVLLNYGLEFQFETSDNVYFKNERMLELDEFLGDIHSDIVDLENTIVRQLEATCVQYAPMLLAAIDVAAVVDCALAFASVAQAQRYCCPTVTNEQPGSLYVVNGRHPLLECRVGGGAVVPNNTAIDGVARVQLLTGPNYSGKSVYLKQNALIVYLAQIGSFVPADGAQVTVTDRIFTRLYSNDSASSASPLSSWALDCQQVSTMLQRATPQSLLLIDEFGKGTSVRDGVALLAALLRHLAARPDAPKALVTTHHAELYRRGLLADNVLRNRVLHTQMQFKLVNVPNARDTIALLYKVVPSDIATVPESHGLECARRAGLPAAVLARATSILDDVVADRLIEPVRELSADALARLEQRTRVLARFKAMHGEGMTDEAIAKFVAEIQAMSE